MDTKVSDAMTALSLNRDVYNALSMEPGASMSANDSLKGFLGRAQNMKAFQQWVGEEFANR